jgi:hypothetical protein
MSQLFGVKDHDNDSLAESKITSQPLVKQGTATPVPKQAMRMPAVLTPDQLAD